MTSKSVQKQLLEFARLALETKLMNKEFVPDFTVLKDDCFEKKGVYVVFIEDNYLRAVSGYVEPLKYIYQGVIENSINAGFYSKKYKPITKLDLSRLVIEVSLLTEPKKLEYSTKEDILSKIDSRMGLLIKEGMQKTVFLPTMWKMYPDKEDFLDHLCYDAGLQEATWKRKLLDIYYFYAETFAEDDKD
jgi:AmmeMemoRadiSam system protein A